MLTLFLMGQKGYDVLNHIIENNKMQIITAVVVAQDPQMKADYYNEIVEVCEKNEITYYNKNHSAKSPYSLAISWRKMLDLSNSKPIIIHDSLLPKYRGFAPVVNALINGENEIGATAIFANEKYDCGPIIAQRKINIEYPIRIQEAIDLQSALYTEIALQIVTELENSGSLKSEIQDESKATYSLWRNEDDYLIDWNSDSKAIERHVDATGFPYKGGSSFLDGQKVRILKVEQYPDVQIENRHVGKVIFVDGVEPVIVCSTGLLKICEMTNDLGESILPLKSFRTKFTSK